MSGISKIVTIMKKILKPFVLVAAAAMAFASCQKNEIPAPEKQDVHFTINAGIETKTSIVETLEDDKTIYKAQWDGNEELGVLFAAPNAETKATDVVVLTNAESGSVASFQGTVTVDGPSGTFYAFYPAAAFNRGYEDGDARLDLKNTQKPTATSFDPSCDILVAKPYDYTVEEGAVVADGLEFARLMSVLRIDLKSEFAEVQNEFVESVSFTAGDVKITGYARIFLDNPVFTGNWASSGDQWCTVTANYDSDLVSINGTSNSVYLVIAPVTIPANKDLTFEIKTKNYNISKTIESPEMKFTAGKVSKINLTIAADNCDKIDTSIDYSGEYLIVNTDLTKAASKWANGNNLPAVALNAVDGVVYESDNLIDCKMTITKVLEGDNAGKYTIVDAAGKYLYAAGGSGSNPSNHLKGSDDVSYWNIEADGTKFVMTSLSGATRNILRYNGTNNPPIFSCYGSGQSDVTLYKYSDIKPDTNPGITLTKNSDEVAYDATSYDFTYTTKNITGNVDATIKDGATMTNVSASASNGTVTVKFDANDDAEQKTATIVLSYGAVSQEFVLTQEGKPASGTVVDVLTRATSGVTGTSYTAWSGKTSNSKAVYAGQSAGGNTSIQLRATSPSGIITTTSGGQVKKIKVTWNSNTASDRTLDIYGKNTAYTATSDLYDTSAQGTKLGSIKYGTSTELEISGDYEYIGLRSNTGAMYLTEIEITWETNSGSGSGETPDPTPDPEEPENPDTPETGEPTTITMTTFSATEASMDDNVSYTTAKGGGTSAPAVNSNEIRLYQNSAGTGGGTITITAKDGYRLSSVTIGSSMATKVAYTIGTSTTKSTSASVTANGKYTVDDINATSITFYCMGTSSSSRLYVNYLSATYVAD